MQNTILEVKNLTKRFGPPVGGFTAVDDISFSMKKGEVLGLLGPNGAGKTTTIQMLLGILTRTSGNIIYFGKNFFNHREEILEQVNFSSTYTNLPWNLTVKENLTFISYLYGIKNRKQRINEIVKIFKLHELFNKGMLDLSTGQLTRVNLAKAFINFPKILLLDEPTASLDPDAAKYIREFLMKEREKFQVSIVFTSHNMAEVEEICDRIIFINNGKIIANDSPSNLTKSIEISHLELFIKDELNSATNFFRENKLKYKINGKYIVVDIKEKLIPEFLRELTDKKIFYQEISIEKPTLEDYFLQVISKR